MSPLNLANNKQYLSSAFHNFTVNYSYLGCRAIDDMNADILKYYTTGIDAPLCPALTHVTKSCDAACVHQLVDDWLIELPDGKTTMWQVSTCIYWV